LLCTIRPKYWFSAHLHCFFNSQINVPSDDGNNNLIEFRALDKPIPNRKFWDVFDFKCRTDTEIQKLELNPIKTATKNK
jgi:hypothetical protein